jgi:hypothetical protein
MQFVASRDTLLASDFVPADDIDQLFQKLEKLEPPADTIKQILARIKQLPASQRYQPAQTPAGLEEQQTETQAPLPEAPGASS